MQRPMPNRGPARTLFTVAWLAWAAMAAFCSSIASAQAAAPEPSIVRYHFGDDPGHAESGNPPFAAPDFDDSKWAIAHDGSYPVPTFQSDGIVWLRIHMPIPLRVIPPLALSLHHSPDAQDIYAAGHRIGEQGKLPPHAAGTVYSITVLPLPSDSISLLTASGASTVIAIRAWYRPQLRVIGGSAHIAATLGSLPTIAVEEKNRHAAEILGQMPTFCLHGLILLIGLGLVFLWRWSRRKELGFFALFLLPNAALFILSSASVANALPISLLTFNILYVATYGFARAGVVEFSRTVFDLPSRTFRLVGHALWILTCVGILTYSLSVRPGAFIPLLMRTTQGLGLAWDLLIIFACLVTMYRGRRNWPIALAMMIVAILLAFLGIGLLPPAWIWLAVHLGAINVCFIASGSLVGQALQGWTNGNRLESELQAAREIQQRLVPASLPHISGFQIAAAYLPATEVGGDFYQVLEQPGGATLIVVGDVSGKGLKAAMTGVLAIGALRTLAAEALSPAAILDRLNRQIFASSQGGFITCLCVMLHADGTLLLANAGHLSPYLDGREIETPVGLPLGLTLDLSYSETALTLASKQHLTLLTDGVVEARNAAGELFGFERTAAISTRSAEAITRAAQAFGQDDDITVLTVTHKAAHEPYPD